MNIHSFALIQKPKETLIEADKKICCKPKGGGSAAQNMTDVYFTTSAFDVIHASIVCAWSLNVPSSDVEAIMKD